MVLVARFHLRISLLTVLVWYCPPQTGLPTLSVAKSPLRISCPFVLVAKFRRRIDLLTGLAACCRLQTVRPIVLVAKSMCQRDRLRMLAATCLQTGPQKSELAARLRRRNRWLLVFARLNC